ncbi:MAG TPA: cytochrome ubiquinol oxidase subunit I, partial [Sporomusaceae bacterium]|nr:cytochrome ubiquinol oxidase subunit I [Sporomusaceae bacterium]
QPWLVYGLQLTKNGISKVVSAASIWTSLLAYTAIYAGIALAALYIARLIIRKGPDNAQKGGK